MIYRLLNRGKIRFARDPDNEIPVHTGFHRMQGSLALHRNSPIASISRIQSHLDTPSRFGIAQIIANRHVILLFKAHGRRTAQTDRFRPRFYRIHLRKQAIGRDRHVQHRIRFQEIGPHIPQIHIGRSQIQHQIGQHRRTGIAHRLHMEQECLHVLAVGSYEILRHRPGIDRRQCQGGRIDCRNLDSPAIGHGTIGRLRLDELEGHFSIRRLAYQAHLRVSLVGISAYLVRSQGIRTRINRENMRGGIRLERLETGTDYLPCNSGRKGDLAIESILGISAVLSAIIIEHQRAVHRNFAVPPVLQAVHVRQQDFAFRVGIPDGITAFPVSGKPAPGSVKHRAVCRIGIDIGAKPDIIGSFLQGLASRKRSRCRCHRALGDFLQSIEFGGPGHIQIGLSHRLLAAVFPVGRQTCPNQLIQGAEHVQTQTDDRLLADPGHQVSGCCLEAGRRVDVESHRFVFGQHGLKTITGIIR